MKGTVKFMQSLDEPHYRLLVREARKKGVTVQMFLRVFLIPEWLAMNRRVVSLKRKHGLQQAEKPVVA